jgi:hypothetical protein
VAPEVRFYQRSPVHNGGAPVPDNHYPNPYNNVGADEPPDHQYDYVQVEEFVPDVDDAEE